MSILKTCALTGFVILGLFFTSCQHEPELIPGTTEICFDNQVLPIIQTSCAMSGCHDGGEEFALNTYENISKHVTAGKPVQSKLHKVLTSSAISGSLMPPKPNEPLSSSQIDIISLWILQGAKHTTCAAIPCDTTNVTFTGTILPITDTYCKGCHSGGNPGGGITISNYNSIKAAINSGRFMGAVDQLSGYAAMPKGGKLSACNIAQLKKWVRIGMPNN